jgi:hypothetical protein
MPVELTPEQLDDLKALGDAHETLKKEIDRAKSAGLDMSDYEAKLAQMESIRSGLLKVYGTPTRRRNVS